MHAAEACAAIEEPDGGGSLRLKPSGLGLVCGDVCSELEVTAGGTRRRRSATGDSKPTIVLAVGVAPGDFLAPGPGERRETEEAEAATPEEPEAEERDASAAGCSGGRGGESVTRSDAACVAPWCARSTGEYASQPASAAAPPLDEAPPPMPPPRPDSARVPASEDDECGGERDECAAWPPRRRVAGPEEVVVVVVISLPACASTRDPTKNACR